MTIVSVRAGDRFVTRADGYMTWHCFSSGPHYDPDRMGWGPVVAIDEHAVACGAGFDWHAHRGVRIASWVLDGALRHEDDGGGERVVRPGELFVQSTGDGVRHRETNAGDETLRLIQLTVLGTAPRRAEPAAPPARLGDVVLDVVHGVVPATDGILFVTRGAAAGSLQHLGAAADPLDVTEGLLLTRP